MLPAPGKDGRFGSRSAGAKEISEWLCAILKDGGYDTTELTSHSMKATALSWAAKFGMPKHKASAGRS